LRFLLETNFDRSREVVPVVITLDLDFVNLHIKVRRALRQRFTLFNLKCTLLGYLLIADKLGSRS
jgi:hypothetical protein